MAFTPTTLLSLPLIDTGTESGTWGELVDNGLTSYLDIAIAGGLAITITTTDVTLANTAGTSSVTNIGSTTAQYAILNVSGAKTAARNLILPSSSREYTINNAGTGGYLLTVKGSATAGVTLVDGERVTVAWNGTDYVKVSTNTQQVTNTSYPYTISAGTSTSQVAGASTAPITTGTGSAAVNSAGYLSNPQLNVTDSGGSATTTVYGVISQPAIVSTGATTGLNVTGAYINVARTNSNDLASNGSGSLLGVHSITSMSNTVPSAAYIGTMTGVRSDLSVQGGSVDNVYCFYATGGIYSALTNSPLVPTIATLYGVRASTQTGTASGGAFTITNYYGISSITSNAASATITNLYGLYLSHSGAGTVTNRYGIYQADSLATNYFAGSVLASGTTGGLGYGTGSGGTVTQATSRTTGVTLSKNNGAITMFSAAGSTTAATFTVTNTLVAATDTIILNQKSGTNLYALLVTAVAAGSFDVTFYTTGGTATDAPVINFALIKAVTA